MNLFLVVPGLCCYTQVFSSRSERGLLSRCGAWASHCSGFSGCRAGALGHPGFSSYGFQAPEFRLSSCVAWTELPQGT